LTALLEPKTEYRDRYTEEQYDEMLNECHEQVKLCGMTFDPAYVLKQIDPVAYRCGFADYQEEEEVFLCPVCGEEHGIEEEARWCCQEEDDFTCQYCGVLHGSTELAKACCEEEE